MASKSTKKPPTSIIPGDESRRRREGTAGRRGRALRSILSFTFLLSILAVTHASASCLNLASSALTSDGVRRSSALDQASVSWTSKAAWTCACHCGGGGDGHAARGGDDVWRTTPRHDASRPVMAWRGAAIVWTRRRRVARRVAAMARRRRTRLVRASSARGALSWLGRDAGARAFCFMSDGTLAPAARVARCWGCNEWGWARGRAAAALFW